jgi:hypothetical protein
MGQLRGELSKLPPENMACLTCILDFCCEWAQQFDIGEISFELGPLVLRCPDQVDDADMESIAIEFMTLLMENYDSLFGEPPVCICNEARETETERERERVCVCVCVCVVDGWICSNQFDTIIEACVATDGTVRCI